MKSRLRIGDVIEINGQCHVVWAKTFHWCCGVQCRIARLNHLDYGDMVVSSLGVVVARDLHSASRALWYQMCHAMKDASRARSPRTKAIHRARWRKWERRWWNVKSIAEKSAQPSVVGGAA